jgi:hypothetical protein
MSNIRQNLKRLCDAFNAHDLDRIMDHFADDAANTGMSKWTLTGTRRDGQRIEVRGCDFYTFRDGKVTRKDSYWKIVE